MLKRLLKKTIPFALALATIFSFIDLKTPVYAKHIPEQKIYIKDLEGVANTDDYVTVHPVPADWNPLTATDEELEYYKYPARPKNGEHLEGWKRMVSGRWISPELKKDKISHAKFKTNTRTNSSLADDTFNTTNNNTNIWAGYVANNPSGVVTGNWIVPRVDADAAYMPAVGSQWIGLGGYGTEPLIQMGSTCQYSEFGAEYHLWYEIVGGNFAEGEASRQITDIPCKPGDSIMASVSIAPNGSSTEITFYIKNETKNLATSLSKKIPHVYSTLPSAEWIAERVSYTSIFDKEEHVYNYPITINDSTGKKIVPFGFCLYAKSKNDKSQTIDSKVSNTTNVVKVTMKGDNGNVIAEPTEAGSGSIGGILSDFGSFDVVWKGYK